MNVTVQERTSIHSVVNLEQLQLVRSPVFSKLPKSGSTANGTSRWRFAFSPTAANSTDTALRAIWSVSTSDSVALRGASESKRHSHLG
jgi:hypothetical protein